jgi:glucokinase
MITLGTGIGGGFIQNGQIFKGGTGEGFEPGHLVLYPDGELCTCGKKGCLETYCSALALIRETEKALSKTRDSVLRKLCEKDKMKLTAKIVFDAARCGDEIPQKIVNRYLHDLGCGLSSIICLFRPHAVILGGGIANEGETLLAPLRQYLTKNLYAAEITGVPALQKAALGEDAGIVGAALLTKNFYKEIIP